MGMGGAPPVGRRDPVLGRGRYHELTGPGTNTEAE